MVFPQADLAYYVTIRAILSYYFLRFRPRIAGPDAAKSAADGCASQNARRIQVAIERLGGSVYQSGSAYQHHDQRAARAVSAPNWKPARSGAGPVPTPTLNSAFTEEFAGRRPSEVFASFSPEPVASASIGQGSPRPHPRRSRRRGEGSVSRHRRNRRIDLAALGRIFGCCIDCAWRTVSTRCLSKFARW